MKKYGKSMETLGVRHFQETAEEFAPPKIRNNKRKKKTNYCTLVLHEKTV